MMRTILIVGVILIGVGCASQKIKPLHGPEDSFYEFDLIKGNVNALPVIRGFARDRMSGRRVYFGMIDDRDNHTLARLDTNGRFCIELIPGRYRFTAKCMMYSNTRTKLFKLAKGDTLTLNFYPDYDKPTGCN